MKKLFSLAVSILFAISLSSCATMPTEDIQAEATPAEVTQAETTQTEAIPVEDCDPGMESCDVVTEVAPAEDTQWTDPRRKVIRGQDNPNAFTECGIGAIIFNNTLWNLWPLAITGNIIWDFGLTGSTSSSASPETCTGVKLETAKLILETLPGLEKDIALGRGKHLSALHETIGCDVTDQDEINSSLRVSYADVVNDKSYAKNSDLQRSSDLYDTVRAVTSSFNGSCVAL